MHALHYANELLGLAFQKLLKTGQNKQKQKEILQKRVLVMIKHCLGISEINSIPEWRVFLRVQQTRADIIHSNREIFDPENSPFPLTQSIKVRRRALVLLPCLIPRLRCENSQLSPFFDRATWQHTRENPQHVRGSARIYDVRMAQFILKIRSIVPYHGSARIPRLTVSVPDYGSWINILKVPKDPSTGTCQNLNG